MGTARSSRCRLCRSLVGTKFLAPICRLSAGHAVRQPTLETSSANLVFSPYNDDFSPYNDDYFLVLGSARGGRVYLGHEAPNFHFQCALEARLCCTHPRRPFIRFCRTTIVKPCCNNASLYEVASLYKFVNKTGDHSKFLPRRWRRGRHDVLLQ